MTPFYEAVAWLVVHIHQGLAPVFGSASGAAWALSIVLLTMAMRLLLFPLFVKQIKNQRAMTALQPRMKELQAKYKNDKEKLNQEMMALWREAGANPLAGCLPLILQIPVFFALFRVLNSLKPDSHGVYHSSYGISQPLVESAAHAKIFGVPISAAFNSSSDFLTSVGGSTTSTRVLTAVLIVVMGTTTFLTQRQLMARNSAAGGTQMAGQQKVLLYVLPVVFAVFGYRFPLGVLLYWLTTNVWSMAQQAVVIRRMERAPAGSAALAPGTPSGPPPGAKPSRPAASPATPAGPATAPRPPTARRPANRNRRNKRRR